MDIAMPSVGAEQVPQENVWRRFIPSALTALEDQHGGAPVGQLAEAFETQLISGGAIQGAPSLAPMSALIELLSDQVVCDIPTILKTSRKLFDRVSAAVLQGEDLDTVLAPVGAQFLASLPFYIGGRLCVFQAFTVAGRPLLTIRGSHTGYHVEAIFLPDESTVWYRGDSRTAGSVRHILAYFLASLSHALAQAGAEPDAGAPAVVVCCGGNDHLGIQFVEDLSGLGWVLETSTILDRAELAQFSGAFFRMDSWYDDRFACFQDYSALSSIDVLALFLPRRAFLIHPSLNYVLPHFLTRHIPPTEFDDPRITIVMNLRQHNRRWLLTPDDIAAFTADLRARLGRFRLVFDGMTAYSGRPMRSAERTAQKAEEHYYQSHWVPHLEEGEWLSMVGDTAERKLAVMQSADLALLTYGSGFLYAYVCETPTLMLSSYTHALNGKIERERDNATAQAFPLIVLAPDTPSASEAEKLPSDTSKILTNSHLLSYGLYNEDFALGPAKVITHIVDMLIASGRI